jgi:hypothetical protein
MFSPAQENARLKKARALMARQLVIQHAEQHGLFVQYIKRPSMVQEFQFFTEQGGDIVARRSLVQDGIDKEGGRTSAGRLLESVFRDLDIEFSWDDLPDQPEPEERARVDTVGSPPDGRTRLAAPPSPPPAPREPERTGIPDVVEGAMDPALEPNAPEPTPEIAPPFDPKMTIRELKEWSSEHGHPVPSSITRKGDIIEWMLNEHSN